MPRFMIAAVAVSSLAVSAAAQALTLQSRLDAFFAQLPGRWSSQQVVAGRDRTDQFELSRDSSGSWSDRHVECDTASNVCGEPFNVFTVAGGDLREYIGTLLTVRQLTDRAFVYEKASASGNGGVFTIRWELRPDGTLVRSLSYALNGVPQGASYEFVYKKS